MLGETTGSVAETAVGHQAQAGPAREELEHPLRIGARGGALGFGTAQVLSVKDEAKALLQQTEGLQLPNDLLLFARTLTYVFTLGRNLAPDADLMRLSLPYLLRSLS